MLFCVRVRRATVQDAEAIAQILAEVAEEGLIATEPPVDVPGRTERLRTMLASEGPSGSWILEDGRQIVGSAGAHETLPGVLSLGMAILPEARGRGGGRMLLDAVLAHAAECGAHKVDLEVWPGQRPGDRAVCRGGLQRRGTPPRPLPPARRLPALGAADGATR